MLPGGRGHGLVADDAVDLYRTSQTALEGRCPELLKDFLEVRGLGLLNIRAVFGETACRRKMRMKLIVHLQRPQTGAADAANAPAPASAAVQIPGPTAAELREQRRANCATAREVFERLTISRTSFEQVQLNSIRSQSKKK